MKELWGKVVSFFRCIKWAVFESPVTPEQERFIISTFAGDEPVPNDYRLNDYMNRRIAYEENVVTAHSEPRKAKGVRNAKNIKRSV